MGRRIRWLLGIPFRHHFFGSLIITVVVAGVISSQVSDRTNFADSELRQDVMDRWGAPIELAAPSVRFVPSGAVFTSLQPLSFQSQDLRVEAEMNYRRRGLVFFSGFDFSLQASYLLRNDEGRPIDIVFVFPIELQTNRVLLSELAFAVDGEPSAVDLGQRSDRLVWTGRMAAGQVLRFDIGFRGRGLESFVYRPDPSLPLRDFSLSMGIRGGENFDYPAGVVPASQVQTDDERALLRWRFASLESGVPVGAILPAEQAYDQVIATLLRRSVASFLIFFAGLLLLTALRQRRLLVHETYLLAAAYALFFVLLAYLAAFVPFHLAWALALLIVGAMVTTFLQRLLGADTYRYALLLVGSALLVPSLAVILEGYTGLIYTLEILSALVVAMLASSRPRFRAALDTLFVPPATPGPVAASPAAAAGAAAAPATATATATATASAGGSHVE